jgi:hypothetical protein
LRTRRSAGCRRAGSTRRRSAVPPDAVGRRGHVELLSGGVGGGADPDPVSEADVVLVAVPTLGRMGNAPTAQAVTVGRADVLGVEVDASAGPVHDRVLEGVPKLWERETKEPLRDLDRGCEAVDVHRRRSPTTAVQMRQQIGVREVVGGGEPLDEGSQRFVIDWP